MNIDREQAKHTFALYTANYDDSDEKVKLKISHTYRVAELCEQIATNIGMKQEEVDIAWLSGLLHDIGRFEQLRLYGTFNDAESVDHAKAGADLLFLDGKIREFIEEKSEDDLLEKVIRCHNAYEISDEYTEREKEFSKILRDADKIDILKVNVEIPLEEIYNVTSDEIRNADITDEVMEAFLQHKTVLKSLKRTPVDNVVGHISLAYGLYYPCSLQIMKKQGYLDKIMGFDTNNEQTRIKFKKIRDVMNEYIKYHDNE